MKLRILSVGLLVVLGLLASPAEAHAVIMNLNGATGQTQTFQNDSNVIISSLNNIHSINWQGLLPVSRGGTGANAFTTGSLLFSNGTSFSQNNSNLFWDNINNRLGIGTSSPTSTLDINGDTSISGDLYVSNIVGSDAATTNTDGGNLGVGAGSGLGSGNGGMLFLIGGFGGETGEGGAMQLEGGRGGTTSGSGGPVNIYGGIGQSSNAHGGQISLYGGTGVGSGVGGPIVLDAGQGGTTGRGGNLWLQAGNGGQTYGERSEIHIDAGLAGGNGGNIDFVAGRKSGTGINGVYRFWGGSGAAILDTSLVANKTFTFPNASGTFGLLEVDQTWNGLNKFEASTNSTIYVGSSVKSGCIVLGDSDGSGVTYVTANDGILTASATKPSICQ